MYKYTIILFIYLGIVHVNAQTLNISSCSIQEQDSTAIKQARYDLNNQIAAAIVFLMDGNQNMEFRGSIIGDVVKEKDRHIVYIADKTKRLHIYCSGYLPTEIDFTAYSDSSKGVSGGKTYYVSIKEEIRETGKDYGKGSTILLFTSDVPIEKLLVNGQEWEIETWGLGSSSKQLVPFGKYHYEVYTNSHEAISDDVEVIDNLFSVQNVKLNFNKNK